jgi:hypothetical protein
MRWYIRVDGRGAILRVAHHVAEREENATEQHYAQEEDHQVPAFEHPIAATATFSVFLHSVLNNTATSFALL